jgi:hypothetical protein
MEAIFSTNSLWFRLASVYSEFPQDPETYRADLLESYSENPSFAQYRVDEIFNICHYRWCVIKGALKAVVGTLVGGFFAAMLLGYPLAYVAAMLTVGTTFEIPQGVMPGLVIMALALCLVLAFLMQEYEVLPRTFRWLRKAIFGQKAEHKEYKPSRIRLEFNAMHDSLKNKYCVPIKFTDEK